MTSKGRAPRRISGYGNIPGGLPHINNAETHPHPAPEKARRHIPHINEHGVPDAHPDMPYDVPEAGHILEFPPMAEEREFYAVPVYEVQEPGKHHVHRAAFCDNILVPAAGSDPIQICQRDYGRIELKLLNEDSANDVRFSDDRGTLIEGRGSLLWHGTNSYTVIQTQDEIYAVGVTAACLVSVIRVTEVNS